MDILSGVFRRSHYKIIVIGSWHYFWQLICFGWSNILRHNYSIDFQTKGDPEAAMMTGHDHCNTENDVAMHSKQNGAMQTHDEIIVNGDCENNNKDLVSSSWIKKYMLWSKRKVTGSKERLDNLISVRYNWFVHTSWFESLIKNKKLINRLIAMGCHFDHF